MNIVCHIIGYCTVDNMYTFYFQRKQNWQQHLKTENTIPFVNNKSETTNKRKHRR